MKTNQILYRSTYIKYILLVLLCFTFRIFTLHSQDVSETNPKMEPKLYLECHKNSDNTISLIASLSIRENGQIKYLKGEIIHIYFNEISEDGLIGIVITDGNGKGELHSTEEKFKSAITNQTHFQFIALLNDTETYAMEKVELTIYETNLEIQCFEEDSVKYVTAIFSQIDSARNLIPLEDIEIHFYVQRMLGLLPVGGDYTYTNEDGEISIEFPDNLVGKSDGNVEIFVKVEDEEYYGNITNQTSIAWGIPFESKQRIENGSLWGNRANAPIFLIIISNIIILGVWFVILYLVLQIYKIRKIGK